jgi:hypothetical protein
MENKNRNTQLQKQLIESLDELFSILKKSSSTIFDSMVVTTKESFSNLFDSCVNKTKQKIAEKVSTHGENDDVSKRDN